MKAILVIDMPSECIECQFSRIYADDSPTRTRCSLTADWNDNGTNTRAEWCPLRPIPEDAGNYILQTIDHKVHYFNDLMGEEE